MKKNIKLFAVLLAFALVLPGLANAAPVENIKDDSQVMRLAGETRIETAIKASKEAYKDGADTVVIAGYNGEVDALTGTLLANNRKAPLLLTLKNKVPKELKEELTRLGVTSVYILGGESVVSKDVEKELKASYVVERVAGVNRAETANAVAKKIKKSSDHVFLALGYENKLSDALAIGPVSAMKNDPVLLTQTKQIPKETEKVLKELKVKKVTIIGGEAVVNKFVVKKLETMDIVVDRVSGDNREETAVKVASKYFTKPETAIVTYGWTYPDALVAGYLGALKSAPILITNTNKIAAITKSYLKDNTCNAYVLGGLSVVGQKVYDEIVEVTKCEEPVKERYNISFKVTPVESKVVVKQGETVIEPEKDGNYLLEAGAYKYSVTKEGYDTITNEFKVIDDGLDITVSLSKTKKQDITFNINPVDAKVVVKRGETIIAPESNGKYKLLPGKYSYLISKDGYDSETKEFEVKDVAKSIAVSLDEVKKYGVSFNLTPTDALVVLKQNNNIITPESNGSYKLETGKYSYTISKKGYDTIDGEVNVEEVDQSIGVALSQTVVYDIKFNITPEDAKLEVKKNKTILTPVEARTYKLAAGTYTYTVSKEGYATVDAQFVVVNSGQIIPVDLGATE